MAAPHYVIRGGVAGRERLRVLGRVMQPGTRALLERVGLRAGMRCLDVGCGGGDGSRELARAVAPGGQVLGIDLDPTAVDLARQEAAALGLAGVQFRVATVGDPTVEGEVDVAYARFLLTHLPDAAAGVAWIAERIRPGGLLVVEDIDFRGHFCAPDDTAFARYVELYAGVARRHGADPDIGGRLPLLLLDAGCHDVDMHIVQPAGLRGEVKAIAALTMEAIAERVIAAGLADEAGVERIAARLYAMAADERVVVSLPRIVQAWGRMPPTV
jgi:SAM-dependent methyltransferase